jgi:hypothetical protein
MYSPTAEVKAIDLLVRTSYCQYYSIYDLTMKGALKI